MSGIGVVLNPYSKKFKQNPEKANKMAFIVGDKASCRPTDDLADLRRVADEFKSRDIDILAISGGDGTIHCTLTTFINAYGDKPLPKIAFLRGGTLNTIAATVGTFGTSESLLSNLLVKYHEDLPFKTNTLQLMKINEEYGCIFGMGVIYNFMESYYKKGALSPVGAAKTLIHSIASAITNGRFARQILDRFDGTVIVNGKKWSYANYNAIYTGTINQLGLNFKVYYYTEKYPGHFHAVGFSLPPRNVLPYVPKMAQGKPSGCPNLLEEPATEMTIKLKKPLSYTIDGDMKPPLDTFHVSIGPKLTVLVK